MSYANQTALRTSSEFFQRVDACTYEQALIFKDDGRPDIASLAEQQITQGNVGSGMLPLICSQPGFGDVENQADVTDAQILSAVQAVWPTYAALLYPQS